MRGGGGVGLSSCTTPTKEEGDEEEDGAQAGGATWKWAEEGQKTDWVKLDCLDPLKNEGLLGKWLQKRELV